MVIQISKNHKSLIAIFLIISFIIMISGCVSSSSGTKINPNYPIEYVNAPNISSGSNFVTIGGYIKNTGNKDFQVVQLSVMGVDEAGNVVLQKTVVVTPLDADKTGGYKVSWTTQKKVKTAKLDITSVKY